jgi:hypothetical protein
MSEQTITPAVNTTVVNNPEPENDLERLKATNKRLLEESQTNKEKYKTVLAEKEAIEQERVTKTGTLQEQLDLERKQKLKFQEELGKTKKFVISQKVKEKISQYAGDVYSLDDLMSKPELKTYLQQGLDEENLDFNDESAKAFVDEVKTKSPYLWRSQGPIGAHTAKPNGSVNVSNGQVDVSKMTASEMKEYMMKTFK